ncbi:MAG: electron transport complex subunit E [Ruminococcaceae bacterium]|nr:electron transport complex subunit E [Oscillospiraceae bacterium]
MKDKLNVLLNGIIRQNPVLVLVLGTCPTLAVTTMAINALGMGAATIFVLVCSNLVISLLRNIIPNTVRIPCYIVVISTFVTVVGLVMEAYLPSIYNALGVFLPLIVVNCIILGRAEMFASKNGPLVSAIDGLSMGLGFTLTLFLMATIREVMGFGTFFGMDVTFGVFQPLSIMSQPAGGFFVFGTLMALSIFIQEKRGKENIKRTLSCEQCGLCDKAKCEGCEHNNAEVQA